MLKWLVLIVVIAIAAIWIRKSKMKNLRSDPEMKEIEQRRFYVAPPHPEDQPADDHQNDRY